MYSQATVRSRTKDQAVLRGAHLKQGKGKWSASTIESQLTLPTPSHWYPLVDEGNSAQSTRPYLCTKS